MRAYAKWVAAGTPDRDTCHFWLEAEQELLHGRERPRKEE
jgi:hypothetical protein